MFYVCGGTLSTALLREMIEQNMHGSGGLGHDNQEEEKKTPTTL